MQTISLKLADEIAAKIDENLSKYDYTTRSEFIRDAIRDKLLSLENQKFEHDLRDYVNNKSKNVGVQSTSPAAQASTVNSQADPFHELERKFIELREHLH
jgi:metal-responsive CopG/Arc/MetJ family transcriptional regulator